MLCKTIKSDIIRNLSYVCSPSCSRSNIPKIENTLHEAKYDRETEPDGKTNVLTGASVADINQYLKKFSFLFFSFLTLFHMHIICFLCSCIVSHN